ncbi:MAG: YihY/virulence factor BrkB family protein, partial [Chloroflexales bacterium]|nr:YihY/virulence factor BrkB family protein [Chloroflexales bacterium]
MGKAWEIIKETFSEWSADNAPRLGAALAFYTMLSLAPLLVLAISIAGLVFGEEAARGQLVGQFQGLVGKEGAEAVQTMIQNANKPATGIVASIIGIATLLFSASGVFGELQASLNEIWDIKPKPSKGILDTIKQRFFSFSLVLGTGFLLLVSLGLSALLAGLYSVIEGIFPGLGIIGTILNFLISFGVTTLLFAAIYKLLPDADIAWKDVFIGAAATSLLFSLGRFLIGLYLGQASVGSAYGAAGTLVVLLIWIYYSAQILFMGAEFTQVYANRLGSRIAAEVEHGADVLPDAPQPQIEATNERRAGGSGLRKE